MILLGEIPKKVMWCDRTGSRRDLVAEEHTRANDNNAIKVLQ